MDFGIVARDCTHSFRSPESDATGSFFYAFWTCEYMVFGCFERASGRSLQLRIKLCFGCVARGFSCFGLFRSLSNPVTVVFGLCGSCHFRAALRRSGPSSDECFFKVPKGSIRDWFAFLVVFFKTFRTLSPWCLGSAGRVIFGPGEIWAFFR